MKEQNNILEEAKKYIKYILQYSETKLDSETIEGVEHYLTHGEYEMALAKLAMITGKPIAL